MKTSVIILLIGIFSINSTNAEKLSNLYAPQNQYHIALDELEFWNEKLEKSSNAIFTIKKANALMHLFTIDADIQNVIEAEYILEDQLLNYKPAGSGIYRTLSQAKIKQHKFCEALDLLMEAETLGDDLYLTESLLFDVYFELGDDAQCAYYLDKLARRKGFDFYIRQARWSDSKGELDEAIRLLEYSKQFISDNDWFKQSWLFSNLADFYGHQGNIEKSYEHYKKALELNPTDWYSLKGLAWIQYSGNRDNEAALKILESISSEFEIPSVSMLKYNIFREAGDFAEAEKLRLQLIETLNKEEYYSAYSNYLFDLLISDKQNLVAIHNILDQTMRDHTSAGQYARLVQYHKLSGNDDLAREIATNYVLDQTFEPDPLMRIYESLESDSESAKEIKILLKESAYELGPHVVQK